MFRILWLNLAIVITLFPGILLFIMNRFSAIRRINEMDKYIICLITVVFLNLLNDLKYMYIFFMIFICSIFTFIIEYILNEWGKFECNKLKYVISQIKRPAYVMILFPICEELIYRYFVYSITNTITTNVFIYLFISVSSFIFVHFFNQKFKCFYKIPFSIIECIIFLIFKEILICIIIHMSYNILVYAYNTSKYNKGRIL